MTSKLFPPPTDAEKRTSRKIFSVIAVIIASLIIGASLLIAPLGVAGNWQSDRSFLTTLLVWLAIWITAIILSIKFYYKNQ